MSVNFRSAPNLKLSGIQRNKMVMIKKLLHTRYRVSDLEKTVSFYRDVLGLEGIRRHKDIRRYCQRCVENDAEVRRCTTINCPFWPYRMGRNPHNPRRGRNPFVETRPEPPPEKANAAPTGRKGGAAKKKFKKDKWHPAYRPRPCLLQVGRATR